MLDDRDAADEYCRGLLRVAAHGDASCADVIVSAGCVPHLIDCLRRWPADRGVVEYACCTFYYLAEKGSASALSTIRSVPGIQATLHAANKSGLAVGIAVRALEKLGL